MITLENVNKIYSNGLHAVKDVNLKVNEGDIFGIIGLSGAGKSSLIRLINRLEEPTSGKIFINGQDILSLNKTELLERRKKIGMIFQHFNLLSSRTVEENVAFALEIANWNKRDIGKRVAELLEIVGLSDKAKYYPSQLSGGQKQRVSIARALANNPDILLSDEATSALDPKTTNQILDLLKSLHEKLGITVVLITHEMQVVKEIANKVAVMQNGEIIEQNSLIDIFAQPKEALTKQFIETTSSVNRFIASLSKTELLAQLADDEELIHLDYSGSELEDPVVSDITKKFDVTTNIFYGNVELLQGQPFGSLVLTLKGSSEHRAAAKAYFVERHLKFEVLGKIERTVD